MPMVAWYVLSNVSYIKRVIKEVLPTRCRDRLVYCLIEVGSGYRIPLCSPRNTNLEAISVLLLSAGALSYLNFFKGFE
jgi:hypothetical protein